MTAATDAAKTITLPGRDRLDKELCAVLDISREAAKELILAGRVRIRGETRHHPAKRLKRPMDVEILAAPKRAGVAAGDSWSGLNLSLDILYEDDVLIALDKPAGLTVHPGAGHRGDTLVDALRAKGVPLADLSEPDRAGLVHRLDKDTSGVLLIAKDRSAGEALMRLFADREIEKEYRAVVLGHLPPQSLRIVGAIGRHERDRKKLTVRKGGRPAVTVVEALARGSGASYARVLPETGRTHQIRVHLSHAGFPVAGDPIYGQSTPKHGAFSRMLLHAYRLRFRHPVTKAELDIKAPLPAEFLDALKRLGFPP